LVDSGCTHTEINKQLVKEITRFTLLELEINGYMKRINVVVTDLNSMNMFPRYDSLVKHNPEVN